MYETHFKRTEIILRLAIAPGGAGIDGHRDRVHLQRFIRERIHARTRVVQTALRQTNGLVRHRDQHRRRALRFRLSNARALVARRLLDRDFVIGGRVCFLGRNVSGQNAGSLLGPFQLQPSEFAKIAFIFMMANFLSRPKEELRRGKVFFTALGMIALPFVLILKEPDLGSALVFFPIGLVMMFVAGVPVAVSAEIRRRRRPSDGIYFGGSFIRAAGFRFQLSSWRIINGIGCWFILEKISLRRTPHRRSANKRKSCKQNKSYNVEQALISVGSGGLTGKGWRARDAECAWVICREPWRTMTSFSPSLPRRKVSWAA